MPDRHDLTDLLISVDGSAQGVDAVLPQVYEELQAMARGYLRRERAGHTLNTTALVHEAYFKLIRQDRVNWQNRAHFFGIAATAMRRILINYAQRRSAEKRGGGEVLATFEDGMGAGNKREASIEDLLSLDEALSRLSTLDERQARVVELRFFGGLSHEEIAEVLGVSLPTVGRDWRFAKAWLGRELGDASP